MPEVEEQVDEQIEEVSPHRLLETPSADEIENFMQMYELSLNDSQVNFLRHLHRPGNAMGEAVPGSGKTTCIVTMASYLMRVHHIRRSEILICSFNKSSAMLIRERLARMTNQPTKQFAFMSRTYHSVGFEICKHMGRGTLTTFTAPLYEYAFKGFYDVHEREFPMSMADAKSFISLVKNTGGFVANAKASIRSAKVYIPERVLADFSSIDEGDLRVFFALYEHAKGNDIDHDDQVCLPYTIHQTTDQNPCDKLFKHIHWLFVDELQDINFPQMCMIDLICQARNCKVIGIGDRDQSIYGWRGAGFDNINEFVENHNAKLYNIPYNYRSGPKILRAAESVIRRIPGRENLQIVAGRKNKFPGEVTLITTMGSSCEHEIISRIIKHLVSAGFKYEDIFVISRTNMYLKNLAKFCFSRQIPVRYPIGNQDEFEQFVYAMAACIGHSSENMRKVLQAIHHIGKKRAAQVTREGVGLDEVNPSALGDNIYSSAIRNFVNDLKVIRDTIGIHALEDHQTFIQLSTAVTNILLKHFQSKSSTVENNRRLEFLTLRSQALDFAEIQGPAKTMDYLIGVVEVEIVSSEHDAVELMTAHRAKGLENKVVIIGDGDNFPCAITMQKGNSESQHQEVNLAYVAITRAEDRLFILKSPIHVFVEEQASLHTSNLYENMNFDHEYKWNPVLDKDWEKCCEAFPILEAERLETKPQKRVTEFPTPIGDTCQGETLAKFRNDMTSYLEHAGCHPMFLHKMSDRWKKINPDKGAKNKFLYECLYEGKGPENLEMIYSTMMLRSVKPEEERMKRQQSWFIMASQFLANSLGPGWQPNIWYPENWIRHPSAQYDIIIPLEEVRDTFETQPVLWIGLVAEANGHPQIKARLSLRAAYLYGRFNKSAKYLRDLATVISLPLTGPLPISIWESTREYSKSVKPGEGYLPPLLELIEQKEIIAAAEKKAHEIALQLEAKRNIFPFAMGGYWLRNKSDILWPFHPEDVTLVEHSNFKDTSAFDPTSARKSKAFYDRLDAINSPSGVDFDLESHVERGIGGIEMLSEDGLCYLIARHFRVQASGVECATLGNRISFTIRREFGMINIGKKEIEGYLSKILDGDRVSIQYV